MTGMKLRLVFVSVLLVGMSAGVAVAQAPTPPTTGESADQNTTPNPGGTPDIRSAAAILVNTTDGGQILFARSVRIRRAPASLTKVVTALVARDEYGLDEAVTATPLVLQTHGSDLGLEPGMKITVRELLYALLIKSANDAGMALAGHHPAGYEHFIALMNEKARSLGAYDSQFRNPHGLDQDGHYSTAKDMAIFAADLLRDDALASIVDTLEYHFTWNGQPRYFGTHNRLIRTNPNVIGVKTGFTNNAGHSLIAAATTDVGTLLTVVMGSPNANHYGETLALFDYGRALSVRGSSGGGAVEGFGRLPAPPPAPEDADLGVGPVNANDPRDDIRWALLMLTLALLSAAMLLRRRRSPSADVDRVDAWLAAIAADARRRR